ncbi:hypothetical protein [Streptomyces cylindrosporus]|uniref:Uncharacterized protein n=1 Tax=Streptomyces cylindrosporus TaxID=2927583 RepID=A0ABS9YCR8_9ACTN|nr:hypothetical protein [Streptomyces cylindrosporus]MCI3275027.1 hypothetical protein [Streptomyces cylindrosporus]
MKALHGRLRALVAMGAAADPGGRGDAMICHPGIVTDTIEDAARTTAGQRTAQ